MLDLSFDNITIIKLFKKT